MCEHCDHEVDTLRPVVDTLTKYVREQLADERNSDMTPNRHIIGCANTIIHMHSEDDDGMKPEAVQAMALGYATVILRLLALEQMSGISADA